MAKIDKEYEARMQGMLYACNVAEKEGIDALKKEIQMRGVTRIHLGVSKKQIAALTETLAENLYTTFLTMTMVSLEDAFGFKKKRLLRFKEAFDKNTIATYDMDWLGHHYISMPSYAQYLRDEVGINLSDEFIEVAAKCQNTTDSGNLEYKKVKLDKLLDELNKAGFQDAADWLLKRFKDTEL